MGNSQKSSFQKIRSESTEEKAPSPYLAPASALKQVIINFPEIQKKFHLELTSKSIFFEKFCTDFEKEINLPIDSTLQYYTVNSTSSEPELLEQDYILCNINREIIVHLVDRGSKATVVDLSLTTIKENTVEVMQTKTFNFLPLKYSLLFHNQIDNRFRLFKAQDTQLSDPLEIEKSLLEYDDIEESANSDISLILYYPSDDDIIKVAVLADKGIHIFEVDKYMRISELTDLCTKAICEPVVLCSPDSGFKIYDDFTIGLLAKQRKTLSMMAKNAKEYSIKNAEVEPVGSEKTGIKMSLLSLPD
jgi:hypothetical protein